MNVVIFISEIPKSLAAKKHFNNIYIIHFILFRSIFLSKHVSVIYHILFVAQNNESFFEKKSSVILAKNNTFFSIFKPQEKKKYISHRLKKFPD